MSNPHVSFSKIGRLAAAFVFACGACVLVGSASALAQSEGAAAPPVAPPKQAPAAAAGAKPPAAKPAGGPKQPAGAAKKAAAAPKNAAGKAGAHDDGIPDVWPPPYAGSEPSREAQLERLSFLGLSDEQKQRVLGLPEAQAAWHAAHAAEIASLRDRISDASATGDTAAVQDLNAEQQKLFSERPNLLAILDPEQQKKMREHGEARAREQREKQAARMAKDGVPIDVKDLERRAREARAAGDEATANKLDAQLESLRNAVRGQRASGGAAVAPGSAGAPAGGAGAAGAPAGANTGAAQAP